MMFRALLLCLAIIGAAPVIEAHEPSESPQAQEWKTVTDLRRAAQGDDDIRRNADRPDYWNGISISERRFSENGFDWHLMRFANTTNPASVLWVVPHDDEDAAFEAMINAIRKHGGTAIVVNSGPGSLRMQAGKGTCGGRPAIVRSCDPNRNFSQGSPLFTAAVLDHWTGAKQPIIALHTNGAGAAGDFSLLDIDAYRQDRTMLRKGGFAAKNPAPDMANYDTLGLIAYVDAKGGPDDRAVACRTALNDSGIHFWHERVTESDGSLSNYLALRRPEIAYFNAESREESDLAWSAARHLVMIDAYLTKCVDSGNKPVP